VEPRLQPQRPPSVLADAAGETLPYHWTAHSRHLNSYGGVGAASSCVLLVQSILLSPFTNSRPIVIFLSPSNRVQALDPKGKSLTEQAKLSDGQLGLAGVAHAASVGFFANTQRLVLQVGRGTGRGSSFPSLAPDMQAHPLHWPSGHTTPPVQVPL
jgi:hypothetical protein